MAEEKKTRKINPDKAPGLVKYFYDLTKTQSPSYSRECHQVKILLDKGYTPNQIRTAMFYLYKHKNIDLRWINRNIEEAILEDKYWQERDIEGTPAYFVKRFYLLTNTKFNRLTFLSNVRKIEMLLEDGFTADDIIRAINYMKINDLHIFHAISTVITHSNEQISMEDNDLRYANAQVTNTNYREAVKFYTNKTYFDKLLTKFEYAYLINLPLNEELIEIGIKDKQENDYKCDTQNVLYSKEKFLEWLQTQFFNNQMPYSL